MIQFKQEPDTSDSIKYILNKNIDRWFFSKFKEFSLPQLFGVLEIHSRNNILVSAPTGATKTLTAFLSILNEMVDSSEKGVLEDKIYCIYISPLKALNQDIAVNLIEPLQEIEKLAGKDFGIRVGVRTSDTTQAEKSKMLKKAPHILITTPESLALLLSSSKFKEKLVGVEWVIVDEIHALAENKRGTHLSLSLERLQRLNPGICRVGLSATVAPIDEIARFLVGYEKGKERECKVVNVQFIKKLDLQVISPLPDLINTNYENLSSVTYSLLDSLIQQHKTTLIFTNTRAGTERVVYHLKSRFPDKYLQIDEGPPQKAQSLIGAHHGSLSKTIRHKIEDSLRKGILKAVVSSTSLELGIDIGYIDLVVLLSSPKSVSRCLQRIGRSGHRLHDTTKGRLVVQDRDDLIECSALLKNAVEKKIDKVHIPVNCLDVLAQQIFGIAIENVIGVDELYEMIRKSYPYRALDKADFYQVLDYLSGEFSSLEDRNVYAKIWWDKERNIIGKRGKLARVIYMTNIGTIPDETNVMVKIGEHVIGTLDEGFLERLHKGDIFVLGGDIYEFRFARGMTAQVRAATGRMPTVPSWFSEMLPLSFDLGQSIGSLRFLMRDKFRAKKSKEEILKFIHEYLYVDENSAEAIYSYFREQFLFSEIPTNKEIFVEHYDDDNKKYAIFHTVYGRRVNDALSRVLAFAVSKTQEKDVEIGINDNGFYLSAGKHRINVQKAMSEVKAKNFRVILEQAIDRTEVLRRRFRHAANRSLMILRQYKGHHTHVGRQQVASAILLNAVKQIDPNFVILKEARREVLEDLMDVAHALEIWKDLEDSKLKLKEIETRLPSPFAFNIVLEGRLDTLKLDDKFEFLRRMHDLVLAKIGQKGGIL